MIIFEGFFAAKGARRPLIETLKQPILAIFLMPALRDILELTVVSLGEFSTGLILPKDVNTGKRLQTGGGTG